MEEKDRADARAGYESREQKGFEGRDDKLHCEEPPRLRAGQAGPGQRCPNSRPQVGKRRQSLPRFIGRQGRLGIIYLCIYDLFWLKSAVHINERILSNVVMMIVPKQNRLNKDILEASECLGSQFLRKLGGEF